MKRVVVIGLCFVAMLVVSAAGAGGSLAAPVFKHCVKVAPGGGSEYETKAKCDKLEVSAGLNGWILTTWKAAEPNNKFVGVGAKAFFREKGVIKTEIECEKSASVGEITGASALGKVTVTYTKCKELKPGVAVCHSTGPVGVAGEIITKQLKGSLVYLKAAGKEPIGLLLEAVAAPFAEIECAAGAKLGVLGSVIGEIPGVFTGVGKMNSAGELTFTENAAKVAQQWGKVEEGGEPHELSVLGTRVTLTSIEEITFEEQGEIV
jgi:hypothetical protein